MRVLTSVALLVAAAAALQSPHRKVVKRDAKAPDVLRKRASGSANKGHQFLNPKTESKDMQ